jgi:fatty-acyl-CoA synthase
MDAYDFQLLLKHVLEYGVAWAPDREIVYRGKSRQTYRTTYERVLRLAAALQDLGVKKGTKIGVIEWDSHRYFEMYFGVPGIGAVLHTINPRLAPDDLVYTMAHAEDQVLIFHEDFDGKEKPDVKVDAQYEDLLASADPLEELPDLDEDIVATLSYTTGTTGRPKGVFFTQRQLVLHTLVVSTTLAAFGNYGGVNKHGVYMPLTPMFHVHAWGFPYVATMLGVKQVYPGKYDPAMLVKLIAEEGVTFSHCVPTILQMVVNAPAAKKADLSRWQVIIGGARLPKGLFLDATKLGIKVYAGYGMSETGPVLTLAHLRSFMENEWHWEKQTDTLVSTGFPIPLVKLRVINPDGKQVARDGQETGEIQVRAPWLTQAYYKDPERSAELWAGGWMHTGDVAYVDEYGYVQIVDRMKDLIKSGGEWIVSLELENLLSLHDDVLEAAVIGIPDERWGERPLAIIVPKEGAKDRVTADAMREHLQKVVADGVIASWAVPDGYTFVEALPRTSVGKIDKKVLRGQYQAG